MSHKEHIQTERILARIDAELHIWEEWEANCHMPSAYFLIYRLKQLREQIADGKSTDCSCGCV